jgi:hypothetical protein
MTGEQEVVGVYENYNTAEILNLNDSVLVLLVTYKGEGLNNEPDTMKIKY